MSVRTANSFFTVSSLKRYAGFYQQLFKGAFSFQELGNRVVQIAKQAQTLRQYDNVSEAAQILLNLPLKEYQAIGQYYSGWYGLMKGGAAKETLEQVVEYSPAKYRALAMLSLAAIEARKQDHTSELYWLTESLKLSPSIEALRGIAIVKAKEGGHRTSLKDLERLIPLAQFSEPLHYYDFLNSYAVELNESGYKEEARNVIRHVVASPFAHAYPEWQETAKDLKEPSRSLVTVPSIEREQIEIEAKEARPANEPQRPVKVVSFPPLKEAPEPKRPETIGSQEFADMSLADKREFILAAVRTELLPETEYNKMVFMLGLIKSDAAPHVIDLEDEKVLTDLMIEWAHLIEPDELAGVLSALRDCEDDQRRTAIIDKMIRKVFEYSRVCNITESDWRLKVERRLPNK